LIFQPACAAMDRLAYQLLSWIAAGNAVLRPRDTTAQAQEEFREVVQTLGRLRDKGWVNYLSSHMSETGSGTYLAVGPVLLTPEGETALQRDRRLGERPPWPGALPWRV
jgi:hypothetical protein